METSKEKAKKLGVPLLEELPDESLPTPEDEAKENEALDMVKEKIIAYGSEIIAVCGTCGKEISRREHYRKEPCGHPECPLGVLINKK